MAWISCTVRGMSKDQSKMEATGDRTRRHGREGGEEIYELALRGYAECQVKVWKGSPRDHIMYTHRNMCLVMFYKTY